MYPSPSFRCHQHCTKLILSHVNFYILFEHFKACRICHLQIQHYIPLSTEDVIKQYTHIIISHITGFSIMLQHLKENLWKYLNTDVAVQFSFCILEGARPCRCFHPETRLLRAGLLESIAVGRGREGLKSSGWIAHKNQG